MAGTSKDIEMCCVCDMQKENVLDGVCEECEPQWLHQVGLISKQVTLETSLAYVFQQAAKAAKTMLSKGKQK